MGLHYDIPNWDKLSVNYAEVIKCEFIAQHRSKLIATVKLIVRE